MDKNLIVLAACERLIEHFAALVKTQNHIGYGFHSRIFSYYLNPEEKFVYAGLSCNIKADSKVRLEHIVPCIVLLNESIRLIKESRIPHSHIAELLAKHWKVAHITKEEQQILDGNLKLKSTMPQGWSFENGNSLARLNLAGISLNSSSD